MNNCNIPENLANRYGLATIGYIYDVNGTDVFNELNDYIKFHNIDYNTDDMFSVYNPSIFLPEYYNKYGYWMMLFKLNNNYSLTPFEQTIYNVKFDNNIENVRTDYINKRVYSDPTFNSNVKKDDNINILYRKIEDKVYGFITPDNIIYLDKDSLNNPNTMFHEFYHLYDKILVNNSDENTQAYSIITRANELIVESGHLNEVQNDINYKHLSLELQQIEARARMIGDYVENKFNNNKISKLVNDIIEYIKSLFDKGTFDDYSNDEILKMNIVDFNDIVINEMINNDESIVSKDLNKVLLNKLKSVFKPYYKEVTFDKNKANSIRKEYEKRADIIYLNQIILDNITDVEYNIVNSENSGNWNLPYDNKLILDLLKSNNVDAINVITKLIVNGNPQLSNVNIDSIDLIKYVAHNLSIDDIELLSNLNLNNKEFNDFIIEQNKKRIYNNTKHFYISVANNYKKYLEYNKIKNDAIFKELYDNIDNDSALSNENLLYLYSIFNKEFKNKQDITKELNKYNIYKDYANSIQAMFIKEIEKNPNLDLNETANNLFDNNNVKILNDNINYFESRYPIWTKYIDNLPTINVHLTNNTLNDILSVYTGELYFNDLLNYKGNIGFNLTNILNKRIIDLFETDEMEKEYIKDTIVSLVGNEIMNNAKFRNDIQNLFNKSINKNISYGINFGVNGEYYKGLQNVKDFVTESLTNERFISYLKSLNILEDVYDRIDFYNNVNTQINNLERNKELLQQKYQEVINLKDILNNINKNSIIELNNNNLIVDDNSINLDRVGFKLTDENSDNIIDVLNKFSSKVLKEFSEFNLVDNKQFQKLTTEEKVKTIDEVTKQHRSITALKDLAAKLAWRIGGNIKFVNRTDVDWKGANQGMSSVLNEAYMTQDTLFHEIMAHPIIRALKGKDETYEQFLERHGYKSWMNLRGHYATEELWKEKTKKIQEQYKEEGLKAKNELYKNLLKELEYGTGLEIFEQVKRDYKYKSDKRFSIGTPDESGDLTYWIDNKYQISKEKYEESITEYTLEEQQEETLVTLLGMMASDKLDKVKDATLISKLKELWKQISDFVKTLLRQDSIIIEDLPINTTLEQLAEIMGYGNNKIILPGYKVEYQTPLGNKYDTLQDVNNEIAQLADSDVDVDLDKITINTKEKDFEYFSKAFDTGGYYDIITYYVKFGNDYYEFNSSTFNYAKKHLDNPERFIEAAYESKYYNPPFKITKENYDKTKLSPYEGFYSSDFKGDVNNLEGFIKKNKQFEQSKEIIEQWIKENDIVYNPEEVYTRGQGFYSSIGAYSTLELDLLFQNLLQHIEDNKKANGEFIISAFTKPIDSRLKHIEGTKSRVRFVVFPQPQDIKWAAPTDVGSGSVWDAHKKINKDKKSELLGVAYSKYPSLETVTKISPNLADIIDNLSHAHNELGIELTFNNFRIEYDDDIDFHIKQLIDNINKILDTKYGKLVKPEIQSYKDFSLNKNYHNFNIGDDNYQIKFYDNDWELGVEKYLKNGEEISAIEYGNAQTVYKKQDSRIQPTQTNETLKESIKNIKNNLINSKSTTETITKEEYDSSSENEWTENGTIFYKDINDEIRLVKIQGDYYKEILIQPENKEYTSQALINLKIAALKEVARKYPRSLITSKVVPINPNLVNDNEIQYSKLSNNKEQQLQELKNKPEFIEGSKFVFDNSEELQEFGTLDNYIDYVAKISLGIIKNPKSGKFNNSKVHDILWHSSPVVFDNYDDTKAKAISKDLGKYLNLSFTKGWWDDYINDRHEYEGNYEKVNFGPYKGKKVFNLAFIVNLENPYITNSFYMDYVGVYGNLDLKYPELAKEFDGILETNKEPEIAVFKDENYLRLGSDVDIQGFKEFVNSNKEILDESKVDYQKDDKELVDMSYELFPELNNIGSKDLFQQYLKDTFEKDKDNSLKNIYHTYSLFKTLSKLSGYNFKNEEWLYDKNMVFFVEDSIKRIDFLEELYKEIQNDLHNRRKIDIYIANVAEKISRILYSDKYKYNSQGIKSISNRVHQTSLHNDIFKLYTMNTLPLYKGILQAILHNDTIDLPALKEIVSIKLENGHEITHVVLDILEDSLLNIPQEFIKEGEDFIGKTIFGSNIKRIPNIYRNSNILSNIYYNLNKHLQLFHSFTVGVKYEDSQSIKLVLKPSIKKYIKNFRKYANNNVEQKGNIKPTSISILNEMADDFQSRYNIEFKVIKESEAMRLLSKSNIPNAFYYEPTNTAYIIEGKANEISVVHELGHAFLYKIKNDNIKLYNNLVEEARNMPEITDYVNRVYGQISKDKYEQEVIMRAIDLYNQDKLDAKENKGLIDVIKEFLSSISDYIIELLGMKEIDVNIINPDTKLKDIADLLYYYNGNMNLSTKNKTQNFTQDERRNIQNIVNGNESEGIGNIAESARNYIVRSNKTIGGGSNNIGREKELLEEFLKENPQFIYDIDENPLGTQVAAGAQSKVYMSEDDTKYVYKKSWLTAHGGILENLTSILLHNMLFNNVEYEILGFYISDDFEKYNIILKQRFVLKEQMYNYDSIVEYLTHNHFIEKNGVFNNFDLKIKVTDLHPGNVYFANNKIFFIDPIVTTIPNSRDIHLGKVLEQLPAQEEELITVDEFYNKYQDKVINMLDIKKIENFNKDKGYAAINVIKRNDGKYVAIKNSEKDVKYDNNNFIPTYQGLLSGNNPIKFYKTGNNYNINSLSNNTFYINEPVEIDEKGNAIIQDYNNIIPTNEIKTIINERFKDNNDYYVNNLLKDIKLSNYLTSEEADRYAEFIKNVNINRNQKYIIDIVDNKGFKELDIIADDNNIIDINSNFSPTTIRAIEDKGLNIEEMNNPLLLSLQSLITNGELSEELTCKI